MLSPIQRITALAVVAISLAGCGATTSPTSSTSPAGLVSIGVGLLGPHGLTASVYSTGLKTVSAFAFDTSGRLWVATADYTDHGNDAVSVVAHAGATPVAVVSGLHTPLGLLWYMGELYVTSHARVDAYSGFDGVAFATHRTVLTLSTGIGENNDIVMSPDGRMLMGISAPCDHCIPANAMSGAVVSFLPDGSDLQIYASKIRAPVGLALYPGTADLLVSINQRDDLGAQTPGDWLAQVKQGQSWGFPACYGQGGAVCAGVPQPVAVLDRHAAVDGIAMVSGAYSTTRGTAALVAEWSDGVVREVGLTATATGYAGTVGPFLSGLKQPVPVLVGPDGAVYVGDWSTGIIYRVAAG